MLKHRVWMVVSAAVVLLMGGCLERKERITIRPDGSASIECTFEGEPTEFEGGDALPMPGSRWAVTDERDKPGAEPGGDKEKITRTARLDVAKGAAFPGTFATDAATEAVALKFPTTLTIEGRPDGTYYHFKRIYQHRDDGRYTWVRRSLEQDSKVRDLLHADADALDADQRAELLKHLRQMETEKEIQYVEAGIAALKARPQDVGLRIRMALVNASDTFDAGPVEILLGQPQSAERDAAINAIAGRFLESLRQAVVSAVVAEQLSAEETKAFTAAMTQERRAREVTEDLLDELWGVTIVMPGEIVAHNATRADAHEAVWEFDGAAMMDRDQVLMVTSRVPKPMKNTK